jgi:hypothetical protein
MFTLPVMISFAAVLLIVWSAKNSHGGAYQKHNPHPSHFLAYLSYALALAAWGLAFYAESGRAGPLFLVVVGLYFLPKSFLAFRAWRRNEPIEL